MHKSIPLAALAICTATANAAIVTYDFTGSTNIGGSPHRFTGVFQYENTTPGTTVYTPGDGAPVQQGFTSRYHGATRLLTITLDNGETVTAGVGTMQVNNIQQAEPGSQVPKDLSLQAWTSGSHGTINGFFVHNMYLAFLPVNPNFSWDPLDDYFGGNAEAILQANPAALPSDINPDLTGSALPAEILQTFTGGLFLGTNHGLTNTVNTIDSFILRSVPASSTLAAFLTLPFLTRRRR
jgi:hypothetical protein